MSPRLRGLVLGALVGVAALAVTGTAGLAQQDPVVRSIQVKPDIYMIAGTGGNTTVQIGDQGVLVVDTQFADIADQLLAEIARLSGGKPIRYVINTHVHGDHVGGNEAFRHAGEAIISGNVALDLSANAGARIIAHENVAFGMVRPVDGSDPPPAAAIPTDTFFGDYDEVSFNGEGVELIHVPAAHTDGDVMVFFRRSDAIATGDIYVNTTYPYIDLARGGTIDGIVAGLNEIIAITIPADKQEGGTMVIPGHGRLADEADVVEYRDMITIIRDRVREMIEQGMTLEQVQAAAPTSDYDGRYGATTGFVTTEGFVEAVYRTLGGQS